MVLPVFGLKVLQCYHLCALFTSSLSFIPGFISCTEFIINGRIVKLRMYW